MVYGGERVFDLSVIGVQDRLRASQTVFLRSIKELVLCCEKMAYNAKYEAVEGFLLFLFGKLWYTCYR